MSELSDDYYNSMTKAEQSCLNFLCENLGRTVGQNAFLSVNPGLADCIIFDIGQAYTGDLNTFNGNVIHMRGTLDIYSRDRQTIQRDIMRLRSLLPSTQLSDFVAIYDDVNVVHFRLAPENANPSAITTQDIILDTDKKPIRTFTVTAAFDVVFRCSGF